MIKRFTLFLWLNFIPFFLLAQNWASGIDDAGFSGGFVLQYISAEYKILKKDNWRQPYFDSNNNDQITNQLNSISSIPTKGFGIGGLINRRISENFDIRLRPIFILSDRLIRYEYEVNTTAGQNHKSENFERIIDKKLQATMFELPMSIKIKSDRLNNIRTYFEGGIKYSVDVASKKKTFDEGEMPINKLLKNKRKYFSYEAAVGFDFYFEYFKASTELKYSLTTSSILKIEDTPFANPLDKLFLRHLTVSLILQ